MIYLVDSNVYIHAFRDISFGESLRQFHKNHLPRLVLSAVVVHELLVGARSAAKEPTRQTWEMAAKIDRRLRKRRNLESKLRTRSFLNDMLIAASARELGATIVTENGEDFSIISSVLGIQYIAPWPENDSPRPALQRS